MSAEDAHRDAFWVITVVGGMSVAKAIEEFIAGISLSHWSTSNKIVVLRMMIFLVTAVRFFIGSSVFFQEVHIATDHEKQYPKRNYVIDFASAIAHFTVLYWLALGIRVEPLTPPVFAQEQFFLALCAVLLYDWVWFAFSIGRSTLKIIRTWAIGNTVTLVPCTIAFLLFFFGVIDRGWFEISETLLILLFSLPDMLRMGKGSLPA